MLNHTKQFDKSFDIALRALDKAKTSLDDIDAAACIFSAVTGNRGIGAVRASAFFERTLDVVDALEDIERDLQILRRAANATLDIARESYNVAHIGNTPK